jgi:endogenous inhibitor of DNA gyrase (YacG/DUF329 family)
MKFPCSNCGNPVERKPSHVCKYVYCSRRCQYEHKRKIGIWKAKKCENCGAPIRKGRRFCSLSCYFRWMWMHTWAEKRTNDYEPAKKRFVTVVLRVPQPCLTNFEVGLRRYITAFNKDTGALTGKTLIKIIGERRLKSEPQD